MINHIARAHIKKAISKILSGITLRYQFSFFFSQFVFFNTSHYSDGDCNNNNHTNENKEGSGIHATKVGLYAAANVLKKIPVRYYCKHTRQGMRNIKVKCIIHFLKRHKIFSKNRYV